MVTQYKEQGTSDGPKVSRVFVLIIALPLLLAAAPSKSETEWKSLGEGVEYRTFSLAPAGERGDGLVHVVRISPEVASIDVGLRSEDGAVHSAAEWVAKRNWVVAINAGMYETDFIKNTGHLNHGQHSNHAQWKKEYQSVFVFGPKVKGIPAATMLDRDAPDFDETMKKYSSAIQNLRLIKSPGVNVWKKNGRAWSEASVALDSKGRVLFLFSRTPWEMAEWNDKVLALPLGIIRSMHTEGGPEASLSIHTADFSLDLSGSLETGFHESDENPDQWKLPNVIGVSAKSLK